MTTHNYNTQGIGRYSQTTIIRAKEHTLHLFICTLLQYSVHSLSLPTLTHSMFPCLLSSQTTVQSPSQITVCIAYIHSFILRCDNMQQIQFCSLANDYLAYEEMNNEYLIFVLSFVLLLWFLSLSSLRPCVFSNSIIPPLRVMVVVLPVGLSCGDGGSAAAAAAEKKDGTQLQRMTRSYTVSHSASRNSWVIAAVCMLVLHLFAPSSFSALSIASVAAQRSVEYSYAPTTPPSIVASPLSLQPLQSPLVYMFPSLPL